MTNFFFKFIIKTRGSREYFNRNKSGKSLIVFTFRDSKGIYIYIYILTMIESSTNIMHHLG